MTAITNLSSQQLRHIADLKEKIDSLQHELIRLIGGSGPKRKMRMSASGRARIAAAQRARWAKVRRAKSPVKAAGKRTMSAAAKARIAAAARVRWAKAKAAGKKRL